MRTVIIDGIYNLMKQNRNVYFLTGDLGFSVVEKIEKEFPKQFINVGVAEQNMMGIASGLAMSGKKVFVYSIIPFVTMRCFEQVRNDICYHNLDVTILGVGAGLSYGILSSTHFALEDIAIFRPLPNMSIFSPADETEAKMGMDFVKNYHRPFYFRIGKKLEPVVFEKPYKFIFGKAHVMEEGKDITILTTGPILHEVVQAIPLLKHKGIHSTLIDIHTIKPLDEKTIIKHSKGKKLVVTVEEHGMIGALGSAVSEVLSTMGNMPKLKRIGTADEFIKITGSQQFLREYVGLTSGSIADTIMTALK